MRLSIAPVTKSGEKVASPVSEVYVGWMPTPHSPLLPRTILDHLPQPSNFSRYATQERPERHTRRPHRPRRPRHSPAQDSGNGGCRCGCSQESQNHSQSQSRSFILQPVVPSTDNIYFTATSRSHQRLQHLGVKGCEAPNSSPPMAPPVRTTITRAVPLPTERTRTRWHQSPSLAAVVVRAANPRNSRRSSASSLKTLRRPPTSGNTRMSS